jgi:glycosyltransferase involved in cell wall biosynthesis
MKIGIYSPYLDTLTGGEKYIFTIAACLSKEHDVSIFWDDKEILQKAQLKFNLDLGRVKTTDDIFKKGIGTLKRFFITRKYDRIIYLSDGSIPIVGSKKLLIHFQFPVEWVDTKGLFFKFKKKRVSKIFCNSYFTKKFIDRKFDIDSSVLYPPVDLGKEVNFKKQNLILTVGRWSLLPDGSDFKKINDLVEAFKKFQKKRLKGWEFAIVTSVINSQEDSFSEFEKSVKSTHIKIYKNALYKEIVDLYRKARIYWHAAGFGEDLEKNPERAEHFGISTVEAMSFGAVPVVINAGGQKEIVKGGENGYLWENIDELIVKTHKVATDKNLQEELSKNATNSAKEFGVDRFCEELNHLIW